MDKKELLRRYEARGDEDDFLRAKSLYEQALAESPDDDVLHLESGYLLECHARNQLRQAVAEYERSIELNPNGNKADYQLIGARAGLLEPEIPIAVYTGLSAGYGVAKERTRTTPQKDPWRNGHCPSCLKAVAGSTGRVWQLPWRIWLIRFAFLA